MLPTGCTWLLYLFLGVNRSLLLVTSSPLLVTFGYFWFLVSVATCWDVSFSVSCLGAIWASAVLFKRQFHKMVKHTQTICRQFADKLFECVWPFYEIGALTVNSCLIFGHFLGSAISCKSCVWKTMYRYNCQGSHIIFWRIGAARGDYWLLILFSSFIFYIEMRL